MQLNKIKINGFKSIKELDLKLNPLNILIGANGSGKSNFISLFELLNQMIELNFQSFVLQSGGADQLLHFGHKTTDKIELRLEFGQNAYECIWEPATEDKLFFSLEECYYQAGGFITPYNEFLGSGHEETKLRTKSKSSHVTSYVLEYMSDWRLYHFHDTSKSAKMKKLGDINDNAYFRPDASNLAAFLYFLKEQYPANYNNIVETVKLAAPFFNDFILRPNPRNKEKILLEWKHAGSDEYFNAYSLSDGTLRFICLTVLLLQPNLPSTILLDEPELGLHPYAISILADLIKATSTNNQVIISTQSVTLVNQFGPDDIIIVDRDNGTSEFKRPTLEEIQKWLDDYSIGDLWEKNIIGGRPA